MDSNRLKMPHNLIMEDRKRLSVSGVQDVDCFDEFSAILYTNMGKIVIRGQGLHVNAFDVENGEFSMEGSFDSVEYSNEKKGKYGLFSRLFR